MNTENTKYLRLDNETLKLSSITPFKFFSHEGFPFILSSFPSSLLLSTLLHTQRIVKEKRKENI